MNKRIQVAVMVVVSGLAMIVSAGTALAGPVTDRTATALKADAVYVDPGVADLLNADQAATIRHQIKTAKNPVVVAIEPADIVTEAGGDANKVADTIGSALKAEGVNTTVAVVFKNPKGGTSFRAASNVLPTGQADSLATAAFNANKSGGAAAVVTDFVTRVQAAAPLKAASPTSPAPAAAAKPAQTATAPQPSSGSSLGKILIILLLILVVVVVVIAFAIKRMMRSASNKFNAGGGSDYLPPGPINQGGGNSGGGGYNQGGYNQPNPVHRGPGMGTGLAVGAVGGAVAGGVGGYLLGEHMQEERDHEQEQNAAGTDSFNTSGSGGGDWNDTGTSSGGGGDWNDSNADSGGGDWGGDTGGGGGGDF